MSSLYYIFLLGSLRACALLLHEPIELGDVNRHAAFASHEFGKIERKAVGVGKLEGFRTWKNISLKSSVILSLSKDQLPVGVGFRVG